ncbi:hypothetical protein OnM2_073068 [Erysiphe neolycopersici]|uniref:Uncharacterized protein n=1 Tax=Erysiphe neolycopersici TaxID=212602 RepID=A0A420HJ65_9PEZI|nr:hypothetical protein OnM2_073068 [Erysiphe neolycopersici]
MSDEMEYQETFKNQHHSRNLNKNFLANLVSQQIQQALGPLTARINELSTSLEKATAAPPVPSAAPMNPLSSETHIAPLNVNRKRRKLPTWNGDRMFFNCFIREVEDCIEIDRDLMGPDRVVLYDINLSLPSAAIQKVSIFNATGAQRSWDYKLFIDHLKRTFGNKQEMEDKI